MADGMNLRQVACVILTLIVFQAVTGSESNSRNSPHKGKYKVAFIRT
jgi:hypothetical protein